MKEIDINIEGYNVNGICVGCLNYNRKMYYQEDVKDCYKILADIDVPIGISIKVCYECIALVQKVFQFRLQILSSFKVLNDYSHKHPILISPKDLTAHAVQRLSLHSVKEHEIVPKDEIAVDIVKTEDIFEEFSQFDEPELKSEIEDIYIQEDNYGNERVTSDDDVTLSALKKEKKKKKKKTKEKKKPEKVPRKLKNLPPFVELYTMSETEMWSVREKDISSEEFSKLKYKCDGCIIAFNTKRLMEMHQSGKHTAKSETAQQCDVCTAYFLTGENLSAHRRLHMNAYRCRECGLVSCVKRVMSAHECARRLERYSCTDCDMTFRPITKKEVRRKVISLETKIEILDRLRKGHRVVDVAKSYSMNEATIRTIRTNENTIRKTVAAGNTTSMARTSYTRNIAMEKMEKALMLWIQDQTQKRLPINTGAITNKALRIYEKILENLPSSSSTVKKPSFCASHGWFERFKIRHSLKLRQLKIKR